MLPDSQTKQTTRIYEFGAFRLNAAEGVLFAAGEPVKLTLKAVQTLALLVAAGGRIVLKDEFFAKVWTDTFVEDAALTFNISQLRKALAQFEPATKFIETVPKRGFRFLPEVREISLEAETKLPEIVFERRRVEEILIEETIEIDSDAPDAIEVPATVQEQLVAPPAKKTFAARARVLLGLAIVVLSAAGLVIWNRSAANADFAAPASIKSIAVLPLKPIAANDADKVLSLGLADALITQLGASNKLVVRPVSDVSQYAEREFDALAVGRELRTDAVLEGSFQRSANRLRVNARLLRVGDGKQIWAGSFDETEADVFRLQDSISKAAATALSLNFNLAERDSILKRYTDNVHAYQAYQRGRYLSLKRAQEKGNLEKSVREFEEAIRLDANYALAYSGLADAHSIRGNYAADENSRREFYELSKELARKAILLDPHLAEAYSALGWTNRNYDWNWAESETNLRRAIELAPNVARHYRRYAYLLITLGRTAEAVEVNRQARRLDPLTDDSHVLYSNRQFAEAVAEGVNQINVSTNESDVRHNLARAYVRIGKAAEAVRLIEEAAPEIRAGYKIRTVLTIAYFHAGEKKKAENLLRELEATADTGTAHPVRLANVYAEMKQTDKAIHALQKGFETRDDRLMWIKTEPHLDGLGGDSRFQEILRRMNLN